MKRQLDTILTGLYAMLAAFVLGGCAEEVGPDGKIAASPCPLLRSAPAPCPRAIGLQAAIFETRLPAGKTCDLNASSLAAKAGTCSDLADALGKLGPTKVLYRIDEAIEVGSEHSARIGSRAPFVTNTRTTDTGQKIQTVQYQDIGAILKLKTAPGKARAGQTPHVNVNVNLELSALSDSDVKIASGTKAVVIRTVTLTHEGPMTLGTPAVLIATDATTPDPNTPAAVYTCRIVLGQAQR